MKYKVGDLFQAGTGFRGEWIDNQMFLLFDIDHRRENAFKLLCQSNGRILEVTAFTLNRDMKKIV